MQFSPLQSSAIDSVSSWLKGGKSSPQIFRLFGYAGSGKTTLAKHLAEGDSSVFCTFTGKAASVLRRKGVPNATTIHKLIYKFIPPNESRIKELKKVLETEKDKGNIKNAKEELDSLRKPHFELTPEALNDIDLVVIDECSMVGEDIGNDLTSFGKKILVLGDPAQLPPISGGGFFTSASPDVLLNEVHRQAAGNPIISMATLVRQGGSLKYGRYGESEVVSRHKLDGESYKQYEQILVGLNKTRRAINTMYRDGLGFCGDSLPGVGDKLICCKNNHEIGILNGTQWRVGEVQDEGSYVEVGVRPWEGEEEERDLHLKCHLFNADLNELTWWERKRYEEFDFGYAVTCHKAQGSQWKSVLIRNESYAFRENSNKWLYTALTRAEEKVMVVI